MFFQFVYIRPFVNFPFQNLYFQIQTVSRAFFTREIWILQQTLFIFSPKFTLLFYVQLNKLDIQISTVSRPFCQAGHLNFH